MKAVNDQGGINGRRVNFITYDDGFQPPKTVEMVRKLVEDDQVFAIYQLLGTPTNTVVQKYLNQKKVPQLFVATGASKWGMPKEFPWTMGWQPDYHTEAAIYAKHVLAMFKDRMKDLRIGILYQNDDSGKDYSGGFLDGLTINQGVAGGAQILDGHGCIHHQQLAMVGGDGGMVDDDIVILVATQGNDAGG